MSRRVIAYEGEGRHRKPVYAVEDPAVARMSTSDADAAARGDAVDGGEIVRGGPSEREAHRQYMRAYNARRRAEAAS